MNVFGQRREQAATSDEGLLGPLVHNRFRALWIANIFSNFGTWMHSFAAAWLMATLTDSPFLIASVQTASTLSVALVMLPAGLLADIMPRPLYLTITQLWMCAVALIMAVLWSSGATGTTSLLLLTAALGLGRGMMMPAWHAVSADLVPLKKVPAAVALNSLSFNVARTFGPLAASLIYKTSGAASVFAVNCASFFGVICVYGTWSITTRSGFRTLGDWSVTQTYRRILSDRSFQGLIAYTFFAFAASNAFWALTPALIHNSRSGADPTSLGWYMGIAGIGAVVAAGSVPPTLRRFSMPLTLSLYALTGAIGLGALASPLAIHLIGAGAFGFSLSGQTIVLNIRSQLTFERAIRARANSIRLMAMFLGMGLGGSLWGALAERFSVSAAMAAAAATLLAVGLLSLRKNSRSP